MLQKKIMRRIYYSFAVETVSNPVLLLGFFMLGLLIVLTYFVSIDHVVLNLVHGGFGHMGAFLVHAVQKTEIWTLLILGLLIFSAFSIRWNVTRSPERTPNWAHQ
jgi:hypothetical protein